MKLLLAIMMIVMSSVVFAADDEPCDLGKKDQVDSCKPSTEVSCASMGTGAEITREAKKYTCAGNMEGAVCKVKCVEVSCVGITSAGNAGTVENKADTKKGSTQDQTVIHN
jgi:hypothetical protein